MKISKMFFVSLLGLLGARAQAADLLSCRLADNFGSRSLRVFAVNSGYGFELTVTHRFAHEPPGPSATGEVTRQGMTFENEHVKIFHIYGSYEYVDGRDGSDFRFPDSDCQIAPSELTSSSFYGSCTQEEELRGCHTEGAYNGRPYCDCGSVKNAVLFLPTAPSDPRQVEGRGEVGGPDEVGYGLFGSCDSSNPIGYLYLAKTAAHQDADQKCAPLESVQLGNFEISTGCNQGSKTAIATALFACRK